MYVYKVAQMKINTLSAWACHSNPWLKVHLLLRPLLLHQGGCEWQCLPHVKQPSSRIVISLDLATWFTIYFSKTALSSVSLTPMCIPFNFWKVWDCIVLSTLLFQIKMKFRQIWFLCYQSIDLPSSHKSICSGWISLKIWPGHKLQFILGDLQILHLESYLDLRTSNPDWISDQVQTISHNFWSKKLVFEECILPRHHSF